MFKKIISGVYMILNTKNDKKYVGSSENLKKREWEHLNLLRIGIHHSLHLQNAFNMDEEKTFAFLAIELVKDLNQLVPREQVWLDYYKSYERENGYNICRCAGSKKGVGHSEKSKGKIRSAHSNPIVMQVHKDKAVNRWKNPEYREKQEMCRKSPEFKERMKEVASSQWKDEEQRKKKIKGLKKGWEKRKEGKNEGRRQG
jgi:group I intron endonuclease